MTMTVGEVVEGGALVVAGATAGYLARKKPVGMRVAAAVGAVAVTYLVVRALEPKGEWADKPLFSGLGAFPMQQGSYYANTPKELQSLTFNQLRQNAPLYSPGTEQAIEQYMAGAPEVVASLPQNMAFNRWRQGGGDFMGNAQGLLAAVSSRAPLLNAVVGVNYDRVPHATWNDVAQGMNALPPTQPRYGSVVSRGVPQANLIPSPQFWNAIDNGAPVTPMSPLRQATDYTAVWDGPNHMLRLESNG